VGDIVATVAVDRIWRDERRDVVLRLYVRRLDRGQTDLLWPSPEDNLAWTAGLRTWRSSRLGDAGSWEWVDRRTAFPCGLPTDLYRHMLRPYLARLGHLTIWRVEGDTVTAAVQLMTSLAASDWTGRPGELADAYRQLAALLHDERDTSLAALGMRLLPADVRSTCSVISSRHWPSHAPMSMSRRSPSRLRPP
jgi:hypothetical protein